MVAAAALVPNETEARRERGRVLAHDRRIKRVEEGIWIVPSALCADGRYVVNLRLSTCSCPDYALRRAACKHIFAVEFTQGVEAIVSESVKIARKTYPQDWPNYNAAQCAEKATVQVLLRALCEGIVTPPHAGRGPKPIPLSDAVYSMVMKVYTGMSARRATTDIRACADAGHIVKAPHYNSTLACFGRPEITPLLAALIEESAAPLACVETKFAVDSTGFGTAVYRRWFDAKYNREMSEATWVKAHAMVGTTTNIVTALKVTDSTGADSPQLSPLVAATAKRFSMADVAADKAYLSRDNLAVVESVGAVPYIPFKVNSQGDGPAAWRRMFGLFMYRQAEFLAHYHQRSNVESTFSAIKRKFGGAVRSKHFVAQTNEVLCKALCHNVSMLVHAIHELGIAPVFPLQTQAVP